MLSFIYIFVVNTLKLSVVIGYQTLDKQFYFKNVSKTLPTAVLSVHDAIIYFFLIFFYN